VNGCMGIFYPFDKGFSAVKDGTPWPMQGAILASLFYQIVVFDKSGVIGQAVRFALIVQMVLIMHILILMDSVCSGCLQKCDWGMVGR
jgi:hypothetical protein